MTLVPFSKGPNIYTPSEIELGGFINNFPATAQVQTDGTGTVFMITIQSVGDGYELGEVFTINEKNGPGRATGVVTSVEYIPLDDQGNPTRSTTLNA